MWLPKSAHQLMRSAGRIAFVGAAKNCGKTTTLNAFVAEAHVLEQKIGLVSIGIDGEPQDLLIGTPKPTIPVPVGALVVSAQGALAQSSARCESVASLQTSSPLGELVLARVVEAGSVMLAGVRHRAELMRALERLSEAGAQQLFIDGAYGRTMAAHAQVSDAVVLCTGAVIDRRVSEIVAQTQALLERLELPAPTALEQLELLALSQQRQRALLWDDVLNEAIALPSASALIGLSQGRDLWSESISALAVPGLVSDRVIEELLAIPTRQRGPRVLLLHDATALQASRRLVQRLHEGWQVLALGSVPVVAISYNPTSVAGYRVDARQLEDELVALDPSRWVFDPRG